MISANATTILEQQEQATHARTVQPPKAPPHIPLSAYWLQNVSVIAVIVVMLFLALRKERDPDGT